MKQSAGLLLWRRRDAGIEVFLVHPGGPYWQRKDDGAWSIPKGEFEAPESPLDAARREFVEETGLAVHGEGVPLPPVRQAGGKTVHPFALEADVDPARLRSNRFGIEWPPRSGRVRQFPEVDRAGWFTPEVAQRKLVAGQRPMLEALRALLERR